MFTNGMSESMTAEVTLKDVPAEAFMAMLDFLYDGELNDKIIDSGSLLLQLLLLADQFGVTFLHQECCKMLLEYLSEVDWLTCTSVRNRSLNTLSCGCHLN